jgi:hypothetical protein
LQARGGIDLHNAGAALGAKYTFVYWMIAVALDIGDLALFKMDVYPTPTGAHVTCGLPDFVRDLWRGV